MLHKLSSIQALRGLAALLVVLFHAFGLAEDLGPSDSLALIWGFGSVGVDVFFVVSGFIMFFIRDRYVGTNSVRPGHFLWKRFVRVLPPYWVYTSIVVFLFIAAPMLFKGETPSLLRSLLLIPDENPYFLMVGWTLSYELYFYLLFAVTLLIARDAMTHFALIAAYFLFSTLLGTVIDLPGPIFAFITSHVHFEFLLGAAICVFGRGLEKQKWLSLPALVLALIVYYLAISQDHHVSRKDLLEFSYFFSFSLLIFVGFYAAGPVVSRFIVTPLQGLGNASYSLYLSHWLVINAVALISRKVGHFDFLGFGLLSTMIACIYALISYRIVELTIPKLLDAGLTKVVIRLRLKAS